MMTPRRGIELKSERELETMREAGRINAMALAAAAAMVEPGVTTADLNQAAKQVLKEYRAQPAFVGVPGAYPYPEVTTISVNDVLVHGIPGIQKLREGDIVSIDCGTIYDGFVGDSALTVPVGEVSEEAEHLIRVTLRALFIGISMMQVGNLTGDVSAAIQGFVESEGLNVVRQYTGHGVGRSMHEEPQVPNYGKERTGVPLRPGMTVAIEPMVLTGGAETKVLDDQWAVASKDGRLTAHFEHTVAITPNGPWILTGLDQGVDAPGAIKYNEYFAGKPESIGVERSARP